MRFGPFRRSRNKRCVAFGNIEKPLPLLMHKGLNTFGPSVHASFTKGIQLESVSVGRYFKSPAF
jgi:hypothetical protein